MNETMQLLLAASILAVGGIGLYMYKDKENEDEDEDETQEDKENNSLFGGNFWNTKDDLEEDIDEYEESQKLKKRNNVKTHKNKKSFVGSRRKHYS
jgi:hypothetical protein